MKKTICLITRAVFISSVILSCATAPKEKAEPLDLMFINGIVQNISGTEAILELKLPDFKDVPEPSVADIAQQVVQKSLLIEDMETDVNGLPATVKDIRGNNVRVSFDKPLPYPVGYSVKLRIPKKTIAVVDFEVIRGHFKEVGRVTLEGLTSALIESGQFTIVERSKLKAVIDELNLSLSGMTKETADKVAGKLIIADLILTGTLADVGGMWDINLRMINVRTGKALRAISMRTPLLKAFEMRDSGPMNEVFSEDTLDASWILDHREYGGTFDSGIACNVILDTKQGPEDTHSSLEIFYDFTKIAQRKICSAFTGKKRDLSLYNGVEFYAKSTIPITGMVTYWTSLPDNPNIMDAWFATFRTENNWKKIRIPFSQLMISRTWIKKWAANYGAKTGDQIFRPDRIEQVGIWVESALNSSNTKGSLWVGKMRFYRD